MDSNLLATKSIEKLVGDVEHGTKALRRSLTAFDLTLLGIGAIIGTRRARRNCTIARSRITRPTTSRSRMWIIRTCPTRRRTMSRR